MKEQQKLIVKKMGGGSNAHLYALHTEDGRALPSQQRVTISNEAGDPCPRLVVEFYLDGEDIRLIGDDQPEPVVPVRPDPLDKHRPLDQVD